MSDNQQTVKETKTGIEYALVLTLMLNEVPDAIETFKQGVEVCSCENCQRRMNRVLGTLLDTYDALFVARAAILSTIVDSRIPTILKALDMDKEKGRRKEIADQITAVRAAWMGEPPSSEAH